MSSQQNLQKFLRLRDEKIAQFNSKRITLEAFHDSIYGSLVQLKIKPVLKPRTRVDAIQNYFYWSTFIERKLILEKRLSHYNLGSIELLRDSLRLFIKRRDRSISFFFEKISLSSNQIELVDDVVVRVALDEFYVFCEKELITNKFNPSKTKEKIDLYTSTFVVYPYTLLNKK
jgi:hypothetical protein